MSADIKILQKAKVSLKLRQFGRNSSGKLININRKVLCPDKRQTAAFLSRCSHRQETNVLKEGEDNGTSEGQKQMFVWQIFIYE